MVARGGEAIDVGDWSGARVLTTVATRFAKIKLAGNEGRASMAISAGTRLGSYEVLGPIGAGGMGVVYRARDVRLGRSVAIKTLPTKCSSDPWRLRRFEQEAKALSAINHPNIISLYALGDLANGYYMVMELVEGETLRHRITAERVKIRTALDVGMQVASALSAAHSAGIVHRDIKPENVMVRPDGLVKVLDFGLAKLAQPCAAFQSPLIDTDICNQDTLVIDDGVYPAANDPYATIQNATPTGVVRHTILGTAPYMSPELLQGKEVDTRTDIFSLGVTLYELIAGVAPFSGRTPGDVVDAILEREPAPLTPCCGEVPRDLEHIISKALRKDRDYRYQDIKDLLIDLQDVKQELEFEAKLTRSAQYERAGQAATMARGQLEGKMIEIRSIGGGLSIFPQTTSRSRMIISEIESPGLGPTHTPVSQGDWVIFIGLKHPFEAR